MSSVSFDDFAGDRATFFREYFRCKPLFRAGMLADRVDQILSVAQLSEVVGLEAMRAGYIRITKLGRPQSPRRFTRIVVQQGYAIDQVVDPEKVYALYHEGATITINSLDHFLPPVRQLLRSVTRQFSCGGEAVAFLTPPGAAGLAPHVDPVDIFVVQIEGTKTWHIWERLAGGRASFRAENLGTPSLEITLHAGDGLYLPPLTPHAAATREDVSLHLGLSVEPRRWRDLLHECVDGLMDDSYQETPYLGAECEAGSLAAFAARLDDLRARLAEVDPAAELSRLVQASARQNGSAGNRFGAAVR